LLLSGIPTPKPHLAIHALNEQVARLEEMKNAYNILIGISEEERLFATRRWEFNIILNK
jgi:hypothetical protein